MLKDCKRSLRVYVYFQLGSHTKSRGTLSLSPSLLEGVYIYYIYIYNIVSKYIKKVS